MPSSLACARIWLAREDDLLVAAWKQARLDEQNVAAGLGPGEAGRNARTRGTKRRLAMKS
jgi:hypothetical protein